MVVQFFLEHWPDILIGAGFFTLGLGVAALRERLRFRETTMDRVRSLSTEGRKQAIEALRNATRALHVATLSEASSIVWSANRGLFYQIEGLLPSVTELLSQVHERLVAEGDSRGASQIAELMESADIPLGMLLEEYIQERRAGREPDLGEYLARCPGRRERRELLEMIQMVNVLLHLPEGERNEPE